MDKETIKRNFSKCASTYDYYASIQNRCGLILAASVKGQKFNKIMDVGCGTGTYTGILSNKFPGARIKALDISKQMIEVAKRKLAQETIDFIVADFETHKTDERFDLISSNAALQWSSSLDQALKKLKSLLKAGGQLSFSIFGPKTFWELNQATLELGLKADMAAGDFLEKEGLNKILKANFREVQLKEVIFNEQYSSLVELLEKIKYTGVRGRGFISKAVLTLAKLVRLQEIYLKKHRAITASYQVFFVKASL